MSSVLFWCASSILLFHQVLTSSITTSIHHIQPDDPGGPIFIRDRSLNEKFIFEFERFATNTRYQVILSWPGYLLIDCESNVSHELIYDHRHRYPHSSQYHNQHTLHAFEHQQQQHEHHGHGRHLLDTDVNTFKTGNRAKEQMIVKIVVQCHATDEFAFKEMMASGAALAAHRKIGQVHIAEHIVEFAIRVDSLWFGVIPSSLLALTIAAVVIVIVVLVWITPFILRNIKPKHE